MNLDDMDGVDPPDPAKAPKVERPKTKVTVARLEKLVGNWRKRKGPENSYADALENVINVRKFAGKGDRHDIILNLTWHLAKDLRDVDPESLAACFGPWLEIEDAAGREDEVERAFRDATRKRFEGEAKPGRPVIMVKGLAETTDKAISSLGRDAGLWQRNGELVRLVHVEADVFEAGRAEPVLCAGTPQTKDVDRAHLAYRLDGLSTWLKETLDGCIQAKPPDDVVASVYSMGSYPVPVLAGVCETPIVRADGTIVTEPGFDRESGWYYAGALDLQIPERPTLEDATRALEALCEPFAEFPFVTWPARMTAIAAILTILSRAAIDGPTPAIILDAAQPHTGKSYVAHLISLIATGRKAGLAGFPSTDEELEKRLCGYAHASANLIVFDDQKDDIPFEGATLNRALTAESDVEFRVLGQNEKTTRLPWRALIIVTGNNIQIEKATTRRVLRARQESPCENPGDRTFKIRDVLGWALENRARLLSAAYTLLRAHAMAGFPGESFDETVKGFYPRWSARVAKAIYWVSGLNVLDCRILGAGDDTRNDLLVLFGLIEKLGKQVKARDIERYVKGIDGGMPVDEIKADPEAAKAKALDLAMARADALEAIHNLLAKEKLSTEDKNLAQSLGYFLTRKVGIVVGKMRLASALGRKSYLIMPT